MHEELHEKEFSRKGGLLEGIQLWVNLPKAQMTSPRYQTLVKEDIPVVDLGGGAGQLSDRRDLPRCERSAKTFSPVHLYDLRLTAGHQVDVALPEGFNSSLFVLRGQVVVNGAQHVGEVELALLGQRGERVTLEAKRDTTLLVLSGQPIHEPVARYGPFVEYARRNHSGGARLPGRKDGTSVMSRTALTVDRVLGRGLSWCYIGKRRWNRRSNRAGAGTRPCSGARSS